MHQKSLIFLLEETEHKKQKISFAVQISYFLQLRQKPCMLLFIVYVQL